MSRTTIKQAARSLGGMIMQPPIPRDDFSSILGAEFTDDAWLQINSAFHRYGASLDALEMSRSSKSKDPAKASWHERQKRTVNALEAALDRLGAARKHGEFLREASENYSFEHLGHSFGTGNSAALMVNDAYSKILNALVIIERAAPADVEVPTAANARDKLVRDIRDALQSCGMTIKATDGRTLGMIDEQPSIADLTPFEDLIDALHIYDSDSIDAFSRSVRAALAVDNKTEK